jgi:hypothetical protein
MRNFEFPAWGVLNTQDQDDIKVLRFPKDWKMLSGEKDIESSWSLWLQGVADDLAEFLWPRYESSTSTWIGRAANLSIELTKADFLVLRELRQHLEIPIKSTVVTTVPNLDFFKREDQGLWGVDHAIYDPTLPHKVRQALYGQMMKALEPKCGTCDLQLKAILQRPRPYQVAAMLGIKVFQHILATSATTPSMISGHCLQSVMACTQVFLEWRSNSIVEQPSLKLLGQLMCDIGDRRVFAGVHYPSDNLSSWYTAFRLIPRVFVEADAAAVKVFLWKSLTTQSTVYAGLVKHAEECKKSPYKVPLSRLEKMRETD